MGKTVRMTCRPCPAAGNQSEEAYGQNITGEGPKYREIQKEHVECGDCGKEMAAGSLSLGGPVHFKLNFKNNGFSYL